jgi:hypothetical protein
MPARGRRRLLHERALRVRRAAALPERIRAIASIHGARMVTDQDDSPHRMAPRIRCETYVACAETDIWAPKEAIDQLEAALRAGETPHRVEWYPGAQHGFVFPRREGIYHQPSAERHWERLFSCSGGRSVRPRRRVSSAPRAKPQRLWPSGSGRPILPRMNELVHSGRQAAAPRARRRRGRPAAPTTRTHQGQHPRSGRGEFGEKGLAGARIDEIAARRRPASG